MTKDQTPSREEVIAWARESHLDVYGLGKNKDAFEHILNWFAALAYAAGAEAEREEIAQFIEGTELGQLPQATAAHYALLLQGYANAIRARKDNT